MMALDVQLLSGRYDAAAGNDKDQPEWPPHPARAFCALVAGARDTAEWEALRWLERQPPPDVIASGTTTTLQRSGYVVTNRREGRGGSQFHPGRTNQRRTRVATQPSADLIRFEWKSENASSEIVATLDRLAMRVPYLGRSTAPVLAAVGIGELAADDDRTRFRPCELNDADSVLRVPYSGYVDELRAAFDQGRPSWEAARLFGYRRDVSVEAASVESQSPFAELIVATLTGVRPDGRLAPRFTAALRTALMARTANPLPAALHGHDADDLTHVAFLALLDAGLHPKARGHLLAVALALPTLAVTERLAILRGFVAPESNNTWQLEVPGVGSFDLSVSAGSASTRGATSERWVGPSDSWVSVTPVCLDRHPKRNDDLAELIAKSCLLAGYPEPSDVEISSAPLTVGAANLTKHDLPARLKSKPFRHVRLTFRNPVRGPVMIGAGRYLGVGLFAPDFVR